MPKGKKMSKNYEPVVHTWLLKGGASAKDSNESAKQGLMVKEGIISVGYSWDDDLENYTPFSNYDEYKAYWKDHLKQPQPQKTNTVKKKTTWGNLPMHQLYDDGVNCLKKGDLVWTRVSNSQDDKMNGYWVARIDDDSEFYSCKDTDSNYDTLKKIDSLVHMRGIKWYGPFAEDQIPGSITRYIKGTICRVDTHEITISAKDGKEWTYTSLVSQLLLAYKSNGIVEPIEFEKEDSKDKSKVLNFFKLVGWWGLEDLVALWLQRTKRYVLQPSTCKMGTETREYALFDPKSGKRISVQTKNSEKNTLTSEYYRNYIISDKDEFYLMAFGGIDGDPNIKMKIIRKHKEDDEVIDFYKTLVPFVFSGKNDKILPLHIKLCRDYLFK